MNIRASASEAAPAVKIRRHEFPPPHQLKPPHKITKKRLRHAFGLPEVGVMVASKTNAVYVAVENFGLGSMRLQVQGNRTIVAVKAVDAKSLHEKETPFDDVLAWFQQLEGKDLVAAMEKIPSLTSTFVKPGDPPLVLILMLYVVPTWGWSMSIA